MCSICDSRQHDIYMYICLFICLFVLFRPAGEFFTDIDTLPLTVKSIFDLCSALMAIEQWGFLKVPHLL